jgi:hypothetical protein
MFIHNIEKNNQIFGDGSIFIPMAEIPVGRWRGKT